MSDFTLKPPILAAILCNAPPSSFSAPLLIIIAQSLIFRTQRVKIGIFVTYRIKETLPFIKVQSAL